MTTYPQPYGQFPPQPAPRRGIPTWVKVLLIFLVIGVVFIVLACAGLVWLGMKAPDTVAVPGSKVRAEHHQVINDLGLLEPGERIRFFYSDGPFDIKDGMYFFTDDRIIIYSEYADPISPLSIITWPEIIDITVEYDDSFFIDSMIWVETEMDMFSFPVSSEGGGDAKFFQMLTETWEQQRDK